MNEMNTPTTVAQVAAAIAQSIAYATKIPLGREALLEIEQLISNYCPPQPSLPVKAGELLPCPFCGGENLSDDHDPVARRISCYTMGCAMNRNGVSVEQWNTRLSIAQPLPVSGEIPTPETDAAMFQAVPENGQSEFVVSVIFSKRLEQRLATERAARESLEKQLKRGKAHPTEATLGKCPECDQWTVMLDMMACLKCTWSAAEMRARAEAAEARAGDVEKLRSACEAALAWVHPGGNYGNIPLREQLISALASVPADRTDVNQDGALRKAMNAYPDSDLVSLATTLEATRAKAEVVFPAAQKLVDAVTRIHIGPEASDDCDVCRAAKELSAALASVPTEPCFACGGAGIIRADGRAINCQQCNPVESANPPQVDATLEGIAQELHQWASMQFMHGTTTSRKINELADAISAHARKSQPRFFDETPITEEWLRGQGFKCVTSNMGPEYSDHLEKGRLNVWNFNNTGKWLLTEADHIEMRTRGQLHMMAALLKVETAESAAPGEMGENDDASRLSEIDERKWCLLFNGTIHHWTVQEYQQVVGCISQGRTAREAIDKAIDNARKTEGAK